MSTKFDVLTHRLYRAALEAASVIPVANGLREVFARGLDSGELSPEAFLEACAPLDEIRELVGEDAKSHARKADRHMSRLVTDNDGIVYTVTNRTLGAARRANQDNLKEALQEGRIGLVRAINEFDEARGAFSTVASNWIRHHVQNCMHKQVDFAKQRSACMPAPMRQAVSRFRALRGREPEAHEVGATAEQWDKWHESTHVFSVHDEREGQSGTEENERAGASILADESASPDAVAAQSDLADKLKAEMAAMSPRNRDLTQALFIDGKQLIEVANEFGLANSRVHQLKSILEKRLRKALAA